VNIDKLKGFCFFVEAEASYEVAATKMKMSVSGLYKSIKALENDVGYKLVDMQGAITVITLRGKKFYEYAKVILNVAAHSLRALEEDFLSLSGTVRISTTVAIASLWITDDIASFVKENPATQVSVIGSDVSLDKLNNYDVALRPKVDDPLNILEQRLITTQKMGLYASEEYVEKFGLPQKSEDLKGHRLIGYGEDIDFPYNEINWHLYLGGAKLKPYFNINSGLGILRSVENGIGIGPISNIGVTISRVPLVHILPEISGPTIDWYFIADKITFEFQMIQLLYEHFKKRYQSKLDYMSIP
jgi:DNA-binding transcriptional LysR family regulator